MLSVRQLLGSRRSRPSSSNSSNSTNTTAVTSRRNNNTTSSSTNSDTSNDQNSRVNLQRQQQQQQQQESEEEVNERTPLVTRHPVNMEHNNTDTAQIVVEGVEELSETTTALLYPNGTGNNNTNNNNTTANNITTVGAFVNNNNSTRNLGAYTNINNSSQEFESQTETAIPNSETTPNNNNNADNPNDTNTNNTNTNTNNNEDDEDELQQSIHNLTSHLRCLFTCLTLPILPLGILLSLLFVNMIYSTFVTDFSNSCSHPLKVFSSLSLFLFLYVPQHKKVKSYLFGYERERDGPIRPRSVVLYDQCYHFLCLWYVYFGIILMDDCKEDTMDDPSYSGKDMEDMIQISTCEDTCHDLYAATKAFVFLLQVFVIVLFLPLLCLPFVYLWIVRRVTTEEAWARLGRAAAGDDDDGSVLAKDIIDSFKEVTIFRVKDDDDDEGGAAGSTDTSTRDDDDFNVKLVIKTNKNNADIEEGGGATITEEIKEWHSVKDCCICKGEFDIIETTSSQSDHKLLPSDDDNPIVQTKCGHLFHKKCLSGWVYGEWSLEDMTTVRLNGRAQNKGCPLCRENLAPDSSS